MSTTTVRIENYYADGHQSTYDVHVAPPEDTDDLESWWWDEVFPHTGDGHGVDMDSYYFAEVIDAPELDLIGQTCQWADWCPSKPLPARAQPSVVRPVGQQEDCLQSEVLVTWHEAHLRPHHDIRRAASVVRPRRGERVQDGYLDPATGDVVLLLARPNGAGRIVVVGTPQRTLFSVPAFGDADPVDVLQPCLRDLARRAEDAVLDRDEDWAWKIDLMEDVEKVCRFRTHLAQRRAAEDRFAPAPW